MKQHLPAIAIGLVILLFWLIPKAIRKSDAKTAPKPSSSTDSESTTTIDGKRKWTNWRAFHQRIAGLAMLFYGIYLATLTGTITQFVLPGASAIGGGAAAGAGVGALTYLAIGTVGAVTGGAGVALGLLAMTLIGGGVGAVGAAAGGAGYQTLTYPLISPWFWIPVVVLGVYVFLGANKQKSDRSLNP